MTTKPATSDPPCARCGHRDYHHREDGTLRDGPPGSRCAFPFVAPVEVAPLLFGELAATPCSCNCIHYVPAPDDWVLSPMRCGRCGLAPEPLYDEHDEVVMEAPFAIMRVGARYLAVCCSCEDQLEEDGLAHTPHLGSGPYDFRSVGDVLMTIERILTTPRRLDG